MFGNEPILEVDYRVDGNACYRHYAKTTERIVPWGPEAGAWRATAGSCSPFVPEIDLSLIEQIAWQPGASRLPSWRRRVAACHFLVNRWPEDVRDASRPFPTGHWQLLQFLNAGGAPARELLESNPALGFLAARAGATRDVGLRRRTLASRFGFPETEHAVRLLQKVPTPWITPDFLAQLRTVMTEEPDADAVIKHLERINPLALEVVRDRDLRARVAPQCITRLSRVAAPASQCDLIGRLRDWKEYAHGHGLPVPRIRELSDLDRPAPPADTPRCQRGISVPPAGNPPAPRYTAVIPDRQVRAAHVQSIRPQQRQNRDVFPEPPLPDLVAPGIRIEAIRIRLELISESEVMHHCAGRDPSYARRVAQGRLYFYRMIEPERLTIALRCRGNCWVVDQVRGACNRMPTEDSTWRIWNWVHKSRATCAATEDVILEKPAASLPTAARMPITLRLPARAKRRSRHSPDQLLLIF